MDWYLGVRLRDQDSRLEIDLSKGDEQILLILYNYNRAVEFQMDFGAGRKQ